MNLEQKKSSSPLLAIFDSTFRVPTPIAVDEWMNNIGLIAPPDSPISSMKFNADYVPYFKQMYADLVDRNIKYMVVIKAAQVGFTFWMNSAALYFSAHEKKNVFIGYPTDVQAKTFSDQKLRPFILAQIKMGNTTLAPLYDTERSTKLNQIFGSYSISITGTNKTTAFTMSSYPVVILDEMSNISKNVGGEMGDPVALAEGRTKVFGNEAKIIIGGTLILEGGILEREFELAQQNYWHMPCPKCGTMQPFLFRDIDDETFKYLKYEVDDRGLSIKGTERLVCRSDKCLHEIGEYERMSMIRHPNSQWMPLGNLDVSMRKGFFINALMSPFESLERICEAHSKAVASNDTDIMRTFVNDYEARAWKYSDHDLADIGKNTIKSEFEIPKDVAFLTMGIDVQRGKDDENYLEYEIVGWGKNKTSYGIHCGRIYGDLRKQDIWEKLAHVMYHPRFKDLNIDPNPYFVEYAGIDVQGSDEEGSAYYPEIMNACHRKYFLYYPEHGINFEDVYINLFPLRGLGGIKSNEAPILRHWSEDDVVRDAEVETKALDWFRKINALNTYKLKEQVYSDLAIKKPKNKDDSMVSGFCRFVAWTKNMDNFGYTKNYFKGLKSESRIYVMKKSGRSSSAYRKTGHRRNEPLDCRCYAYAMMLFAQKSVSHGHPMIEQINSVFFG